MNARFVSEFGIQSFPDYKTVCEYTLPQERNLCSYVMDLHQKNQDHAGNAKIIYYVMQDLPYPQNTRDAVYASQIVQAEAMRCGVEYWRSNRGRCMGALYWQLNDCWPAPTWAGIDSAGRWKALHYVAKRFFAPLAACAREQEGQVALYAMNETLEEDCGALSWRLCGPDGETVQSGTAQVRIPPLSAVQAQTLDFSQALEQPDARRRLHLEYRLQGNHGQSRGSLLFVKPKHYLFNDPRLHTHVEKTADGFAVHVRAEAFAQYVALDLENADAVFDDNFFDLSSDEEKIVPLHADRIRADLSLEDVRRQLTVRSLFDLF